MRSYSVEWLLIVVIRYFSMLKLFSFPKSCDIKKRMNSLLQAISGECGFLAANMYAKSIFGEDALANLSIEKPIEGGPDAVVIGHIRIRAKSQVIFQLSHEFGIPNMNNLTSFTFDRLLIQLFFKKWRWWCSLTPFFSRNIAKYCSVQSNRDYS